MKALYIHAGVLVVASVLGLAAWSKEAPDGSEMTSDRVEVWSGSPDSFESARFEAPNRNVRIEAKKDSQGRYYVVEVDREEGAKPASDKPDAGMSAAPKNTSQRFIGVKTAEDFVKQVAPLLAMRKVGAVEPKRAEEFGLDKPEGTLKVKIRGVEHALVIGGTTPGGSERYARESKSGVVYAIPGDLAQSMLGAESRLLERDLHGFDVLDVTRVRVSKRGKSRDVSALAEKKGGWADPANPGKPDETMGNWMSKVDRLHVQEYVEAPKSPLRPEDAVVRIEYFAGAKPLGYLELYKVANGPTSEYFVKSERTRWAAKVLTSAGEQVDQDLGSVLK
jgi:hypothetical protein